MSRELKSRCEICPYVHYEQIKAWDEDNLKEIHGYEVSCKTLNAPVTKVLDPKQPYPARWNCPFKEMTDEEFKKYVDSFYDDEADWL